jgi:NADPH:quinone reductase-like Zn-dependent oxidoreductase
MRAVTYTRPGDPSVLELVERPTPEPGAGEIRIRLLVSGVNPTDWKARSGATGLSSDYVVDVWRFWVGRAGAKKSMSSCVTRSGSS